MLTTFNEVDMHTIFELRSQSKEAFLEKFNIKLGYMGLFTKACTEALKDFPAVNAQIDGDQIVYHDYVDMGIAVSAPKGLMVPVVRNAESLSLAQIEIEIGRLAKRARENKLKPDEITGGTYTVTNIGSFGNIAGTAIINQPQVAIMALGAIRKMPAVIETPEGDLIGIRHKMILSHSYDHRVVDGMLGGLFAKRLAEYLENFDGEGLL